MGMVWAGSHEELKWFEFWCNRLTSLRNNFGASLSMKSFVIWMSIAYLADAKEIQAPCRDVGKINRANGGWRKARSKWPAVSQNWSLMST